MDQLPEEMQSDQLPAEMQ